MKNFVIAAVVGAIVVGILLGCTFLVTGSFAAATQIISKILFFVGIAVVGITAVVLFGPKNNMGGSRSNR